ncbi:hypothetical protein EQH50_00465 [Klebsiella quasipneumoniae]|nr:hypothetical protein EQH50_00465 [Klebsiella quasipneumoniae]
MSQPRKSRYRATNWKQYNAALKARGFFDNPLRCCSCSDVLFLCMVFLMVFDSRLFFNLLFCKCYLF